MASFLFWAHLITAVISALLIIVLAIQLHIRRFKFHRQIAYIMAATGILSLIFSYLIGISLSPGTMVGSHNIAGFASLGFSLLLLFIRAKGGKMHCYIGYIAAFFAILSIITGFLAYGAVLFNSTGATATPAAPALNETVFPAQTETPANLSAKPAGEPDGVNTCPFGLENDPYPGRCFRYVDTNNDGICDRSQ